MVEISWPLYAVSLMVLVVATLLFFFGAVNLAIFTYKNIKKNYWRQKYETAYEKQQRRLKNSRKKLPRQLGLLSLQNSFADHPDEAAAIEKARWRLEDL